MGKFYKFAELKNKMLNALNGQINKEFESEHLYLSMASYFSEINLDGFEHWMLKQAEEEHSHAMKFYKYVSDSLGVAEFKDIKVGKYNWKSPLQVFQAVVSHEKYIANELYKLSQMARELKDYTTEVALQWFLTEQVEEINQATLLLARLKKINTNPGDIYILNKELKGR